MKELFAAVLRALERGESAALCSIIASSGSTPRGSGAKMAVFADGATLGTVGGGAVEHECILLARQALGERRAFAQGFSLTKNQTADIGMICGGDVTVYFQCFAGGDAQAIALLGGVLAQLGKRENAWLVTEIAHGGASGMAVYARPGICVCGARMDESRVLPLLRPRAALDGGDPAYYAEPLTRAETVYVFGGGHVSRELVPLICHVGFAVVVFEDREAFARPELFPAAERTILGDFARIGEQIAVKPEDYAVVMTRGHQSDLILLDQLLRTDASYVGVIGSRRKIAATNARLMERGVKESALARVHTPIGLPIGAETPAEIAVSVAAELIAHRAGLNGGQA